MRSIALPHSARIGPSPRPLLIVRHRVGHSAGWWRAAVITVAVATLVVTLSH